MIANFYPFEVYVACHSAKARSWKSSWGLKRTEPEYRGEANASVTNNHNACPNRLLENIVAAKVRMRHEDFIPSADSMGEDALELFGEA